jgi:YHS domain-containing protein
MSSSTGLRLISIRHRDTLYRFCSLECARRFLRDPDAYIDTRGG